jgi:hypothetical protein
MLCSVHDLVCFGRIGREPAGGEHGIAGDAAATVRRGGRTVRGGERRAAGDAVRGGGGARGAWRRTCPGSGRRGVRVRGPAAVLRPGGARADEVRERGAVPRRAGRGGSSSAGCSWPPTRCAWVRDN